MTEQTFYIANDGKRFTDRQECLDYEAMRNIFPNGPVTDERLQLFDSRGRQTTDLAEAIFVFARGGNARLSFRYLCSKASVPIPSTSEHVECYYFDDKTGCWQDFETVLRFAACGTGAFFTAKKNFGEAAEAGRIEEWD